jgi:ubiquinone/menaquinone biosynthesis C-methylase UbiE
MKMTLLSRIGRRFGMALSRLRPAEAYNCWAATYDTQPNNVVFALESPLFTELLGRMQIEGKAVLDVGCGTGRHWAEIISRKPAKLFGIDPSPGMLEQLKRHYPDSHIICAEGDRLPQIDGSFDLIVSTLALAHIPDPAGAIGEWSRLLRTGGAIIITDFHPNAIRAGMKRTFASEGRTMDIEHYATDLDDLRHIATECGLTVLFTAERAIDDTVRALFERAGFAKGYEEHRNQPLVFGMHFMKT